ncbi:hypothetical protein GOV08_00890 [Candidatus Woesearchaeota archaeon]|nr:hypothetical protein [Candidatus Woesearchaeota archaeon]
MTGFKRKTNLFERILLPIAFIVGIAGFYMISTAKTEIAIMQLLVVFSWLILIFLMILAATNEDVKEELGTIIQEQVDEIRIIKELNHDLLTEFKLLRQENRKK